MDRMDIDDDEPAVVARTEAPFSEEFAHIEALEVTDKDAALKAWSDIAAAPVQGKDDFALKRKEAAILKQGKLLLKLHKTTELGQLILATRPFLDSLSKARGGQLFKNLLDFFLETPNAVEEKVSICNDCIAWAQAEKRTFLRQSLEIRLVQLLLQARSFQSALARINPMLKELKRLDDKSLLVDVHLMESKAYYAVSNYPKSRAALVAARSLANGIYCPPKMQAALDLQSGILHAQEGDFKTAYSYFYEAFEGFDSATAPSQAIQGLKYMLLTKIMLDQASEVSSVITGKLALQYSGRDLDAMTAIANASIHRSLAEFHTALAAYHDELAADIIISAHLQELRDSLLQQNLVRLVEPFARVEIGHIAGVIGLETDIVERKLSQMILDKKLNGILDQGTGCLAIFDAPAADKTYTAALATVQQMGHVVDALYKRAQKIF
eukprot:m.225861 g.225861  ORF g.225861 m.225861 type:complete len:439 (+) comp11329_c0_seq1:71-1387(+)